MNAILKSLVKPLVVSFLTSEIPFIVAKLHEKGYSDTTIKLVTDIINDIIVNKGGE